ncbi:MAG: hypothetical protein M3541_19005 [Acidobacteriota bacterium]|nr:hypothetical protein [Acidobacteriota bacterium]MDQ3420830.1 hypothetical protein [Acidobacteriota bacterium]
MRAHIAAFRVNAVLEEIRVQPGLLWRHHERGAVANSWLPKIVQPGTGIEMTAGQDCRGTDSRRRVLQLAGYRLRLLQERGPTAIRHLNVPGGRRDGRLALVAVGLLRHAGCVRLLGDRPPARRLLNAAQPATLVSTGRVRHRVVRIQVRHSGVVRLLQINEPPEERRRLLNGRSGWLQGKAERS